MSGVLSERGDAFGVGVDAPRVPTVTAADVMRTAAFGLLAEGAEHWVEADDLAFTADPAPGVIDSLNGTRDRILTREHDAA